MRTGLRRGTDRNVAPIPDEIEGHVVKSEDRRKVRKSIRKALYKMFAGFPDSTEFSKEDMVEMKKGNAPIAPKSQRVDETEGGKRYNIHHKKCKRHYNDKVSANLLDNLVIVSPLYHMTAILTNIAHFGYFRGAKKDKQEEERERKIRQYIK